MGFHTLDLLVMVSLASVGGALTTAVAGSAQPDAREQASEPASDKGAAAYLRAGRLILDSRLRYELVAQDGLENANAVTLGMRFGYEFKPTDRLSFLAEGEAVAQLTDGYTDTVRVVPGRPVVADPEDLQLNRLRLRYDFGKERSAVIGRQRIVYDDARFVGNVIFRQNEQTYDAASFDWKASSTVRVRYAYIDQVNRIFGTESPVGTFESDSHIAQVDVATGAAGKWSAFVNALDFNDSPSNSAITYGLRWAQPVLMGETTMTLEADAATQQDYRDSTRDFDVSYGKAKASVSRGPYSMGFAGEWLGGDGQSSFQTPLATLHKFQGFADVFLRTPADGLRDLNLTLGWRSPEPVIGEDFRLMIRGHDFTDDSGDDRFGRELDGLARLKLNELLTLELRAAYFDGRRPEFASRTRIWIAAETSF